MVSTCANEQSSSLTSDPPSRREFDKLRTAALTGNYDGPENEGTSPLISAYGAYILGLILEDNPQANVESAIKAYGVSITILGKGLVPINWFLLATEFSYKIKPRQLPLLRLIRDGNAGLHRQAATMKMSQYV